MGCIYCLTNKINGKFYIGQTVNFKRRMKEYRNKSSNMTRNSEYEIMQVMHEVGYRSFDKTILEDDIQREQLNEREIYWIAKLNARNPNIGYNSKSGGAGGSLCERSKALMRESSKTFRHSEAEKLKRSKPIIVVSPDGNVSTENSAKAFGEKLGVDRSVISRSIKRGLSIFNYYAFYEDVDERSKYFADIVERKSTSNNTNAKISLKKYMRAYNKIRV